MNGRETQTPDTKPEEPYTKNRSSELNEAYSEYRKAYREMLVREGIVQPDKFSGR